MTLMDSLKSTFKLLKLFIFSFFKPHSLQSKISKITDEKSITHFYDNPKGMFYDKIELVIIYKRVKKNNVPNLKFRNFVKALFRFFNFKSILRL